MLHANLLLKQEQRYENPCEPAGRRDVWRRSLVSLGAQRTADEFLLHPRRGVFVYSRHAQNIRNPNMKIDGLAFCILYEDRDRAPEIFLGEGAESFARQRFRIVKIIGRVI
jgi:hypothetical protein